MNSRSKKYIVARIVKYLFLACLLMSGYDVSVADVGTKKTACFVNFLRKLIAPTRKKAKDFIVPIKYPKRVKFQDVLDTNEEIKVNLKNLGFGFKRINKKNDLLSHLQNETMELDIPFHGKEYRAFLKMGVLKITKLPEASARSDYFVNAFKHPMMKSYMKRLEKMGYDLVIDPTLGYTGIGGYFWKEIDGIGLLPSSTWGDFVHEFRHAQIEFFLRKNLLNTQSEVLVGKKLEKILSPEVVKELGGIKKVRRIESLMSKELPIRAVSEILAVESELGVMGFKKFTSFAYAKESLKKKKYAMVRQASELSKLGKSKSLTLRQKKEFIKAYVEAMLISSVKPKTFKVGAIIGGGTIVSVFYSEQLKMIVYKFRDGQIAIYRAIGSSLKKHINAIHPE